MSDIKSLNNSSTASQATTSTRSQRRDSVTVTHETRKNSNSLTEITVRTTTSEVKETTQKRYQLESTIKKLNDKLEENGVSGAKFQMDDDESLSVKFVDADKGVTFEVSKTFTDAIEEVSENSSGFIMDTFA